MTQEELKKLPRKYKNDRMNFIYWFYIAIEDVSKVRCGGNLDCSFLSGYNGNNSIMSRISLLRASYAAGKDYRKKHEKYFS